MQLKPKKVFGLLIVLGLAIVLSGCTNAPAKIGVMDMQEVLNKSDRAATLRNELTEIGNDLESNIQNKEDDISDQEQKEEQERVYQEFVNNKKRLEDKLNQEINAVLDNISKEQNIDVILYKNGVHYGGSDITDDVIKALDSQNGEDGAEDETS